MPNPFPPSLSTVWKKDEAFALDLLTQCITSPTNSYLHHKPVQCCCCVLAESWWCISELHHKSLELTNNLPGPASQESLQSPDTCYLADAGIVSLIVMFKMCKLKFQNAQCIDAYITSRIAGTEFENCYKNLGVGRAFCQK